MSGPCPLQSRRPRPTATARLRLLGEQQHYGVNHQSLIVLLLPPSPLFQGCSKADGLTPFSVYPPSFSSHISNCFPVLICNTRTRNTIDSADDSITPNRPTIPNSISAAAAPPKNSHPQPARHAHHAVSYLHQVPTCLDISAVQPNSCLRRFHPNSVLIYSQPSPLQNPPVENTDPRSPKTPTRTLHAASRTARCPTHRHGRLRRFTANRRGLFRRPPEPSVACQPTSFFQCQTVGIWNRRLPAPNQRMAVGTHSKPAHRTEDSYVAATAYRPLPASQCGVTHTMPALRNC